MSLTTPPATSGLGIDSPPPIGISPGLPAESSFAAVWDRLGRVPLERICIDPPIGQATEADAADSKARYGVCCELIDNVLVAKPKGWYESRVAMALAHFLDVWLDAHPLGLIGGADGPVRLLPRLVRMPDVCFVSFARLPPRERDPSKTLDVAPELAVEVLSESNTPGEMSRKLREYFAAGVQLVWYIDPRTRTAEVYTSPEQPVHVPADGKLSGGAVLPGFEVTLEAIFHRADPRPITSP
jgi:Uma2 family endonuclease